MRVTMVSRRKRIKVFQVSLSDQNKTMSSFSTARKSSDKPVTAVESANAGVYVMSKWADGKKIDPIAVRDIEEPRPIGSSSGSGHPKSPGNSELPQLINKGRPGWLRLLRQDDARTYRDSFERYQVPERSPTAS